MTMFVVRDDDANATTDPERLERTYAPLLEAGIPLNLAVIPEVALDTRGDDGMRERYLHDDFEDCAREVALTPNSPVAGWLRKHEAAVTVLAHGLSHRRRRGGSEFGALTFDEALPLIGRARHVIEQALGSRPIGFVPPWHALSEGSFMAAASTFDLVSTGWIHRSCVPLRAWPGLVLERLGRREAFRVGQTWCLQCRTPVRRRIRPEEIPGLVRQVGEGADVGVVILHHWMFREGPEPHPIIVALARELGQRHTGSARDAIRYLEALPRWRVPNPVRAGRQLAALARDLLRPA